MVTHLCPACDKGTKGKGKYLCYDCWGQLTLPTRRALNRTDMKAMGRLQELYDQVTLGIPLDEIEVSP